MTLPEHHQPAPAASTPPPAPAPQRTPRAWLPWIIATVAVLALAIGAAVVLIGNLSGDDGLSKEVAQRECRTALEHEAAKRADLDVGAIGIVVTVKSVDLQETYETTAGWKVNGTVAYTLTSGVLGQTEQAVSLTCDATGTDTAVQAAVTNRT